MTKRAIRVAALATACWWLTTASAAAQAKGPFKEVDVDLRAAIVNDTLPFDVPFIVTATIDDAVTDVQAWIKEIPRPPRNAVSVDLRCPETVDASWRAIRRWRDVLPGVKPAPAGTDPPARKFRLLFPALEANRFYCVRFELGPPRELTPDQAAAFARRVVSLIDQPLREYATGELVPIEETRRVRQTMIAVLASLAGPQAPRPRPNSIFDPRISDEAVHPRLQKLLHPIVDAQAARASMVRNLETSQKSISTPAADVDRRWLDVVERLAKRLNLSSADRAAAVGWLARHRVSVSRALTALGRARDAWDRAAVDAIVAPVQAAIADVGEGLKLVEKLVGALPPADPDVKLAIALQASLANELSSLEDAESELINPFDPSDETRGLAGHLARRQRALTDLAAEFESIVRTEVELITTSIGNFDTRHGWYVSMDAGIAYGWQINQAFGYLGTNIYFRPVNKAAPLQSFGSFAQSFSRRFSAMIGLTIAGQIEETGRREALIGGRVLVVGAGLRLTDSIRAAGGALVFKAVDPNPLVTDRRVEVSPFVSLSFDIDVVGTLGALGQAFGVTTPKPNATIQPGGVK